MHIKQGFLSKNEILRRTGVSAAAFRHYRSRHLLPEAVRRSLGRGRGVVAVYPEETIELIKDIRRRLDRGEKLDSIAGIPDSIAQSTLDRELVIRDFKRTPGLEDADDAQLDSYLECIVASGLIENAVTEATRSDREVLVFPHRAFVSASVRQLGESIARARRAGLGPALAEVCLSQARVSLAEALTELEADTMIEKNQRQRSLKRKKADRMRAALTSVEQELRKMELL